MRVLTLDEALEISDVSWEKGRSYKVVDDEE